MRTFKQKKKNRSYSSVETAGCTSPFGIINRSVGMKNPEMAVYDAIRNSVPIVDAAIEKIIRLAGSFKVNCSSPAAEYALNQFLKTVPTGGADKGIDSFIRKQLDCLLTYGISVGELAVGEKTGALLGVYSASLRDVEICQGENPFALEVFSKSNGFREKPLEHPERIIISTIGSSPSAPFGTSLLSSLPFVCSVLLKIFNCIGNNFERVGNLRYAVTCRLPDDADEESSRECVKAVAREWSSAMSDREAVRDFVAAGDVDIKVIGSDNQILDTEIPVRLISEQIVAKTGLPPFCLGLSWSSTERMSSEQADLLTSELEYYRTALSVSLNKICREFLEREGFNPSFEIVWNDINLKDETELAKARLYRAQAAAIEKENNNEN